MAKKRGVQKGAQRHAEGQHGEKAHRRFIEQLHEGAARESDEEKELAAEARKERQDGGHRLREDRQQHDEAEKNSESNRLEQDLGEDVNGERNR